MFWNIFWGEFFKIKVFSANGKVLKFVLMTNLGALGVSFDLKFFKQNLHVWKF
jgi:hypothetical protein